MNLTNKTITIGTTEITYAQLCRMALESVPPQSQGISIFQMRTRLALAGKVENADGTIDLDAKEAKEMLDVLNGFPWAIVDQQIVDFVDEVEALTHE